MNDPQSLRYQNRCVEACMRSIGYTIFAVIFRRFPTSCCLPLIATLFGCANQSVSPSDKTLIREADQLHAQLAPACVEDRDPRLKRYIEQIAARILASAKELDQEGLIKSRGHGSNAWMFDKDVDFHLAD